MLHEGQIIKNYRAMCELLGEAPTTGNAKKAQIKNWERYFEIEKISGTQKLRIAEIYASPHAQINGRTKGGHSIYIDSVEVILLNYLAHAPGRKATFTKNKLYRQLGMVNDRYHTATDLELKKANPGLTDFDITKFRITAGSRLNRILMSALKNLEKRFLIDIVEQVVLVDSNCNYALADDDMRSKITSLKYKVKKDMGFETEQEILLSGKIKDFYRAVNYYLKDMYGYERVYTQFKFLYEPLHIQQEAPILAEKLNKRLREIETLGNDEIRKELITMNNLVLNALNRSAAADYENTSAQGKFKLTHDYVEKQRYLADTLIRRKDNIEAIEYGAEELDELFSMT